MKLWHGTMGSGHVLEQERPPGHVLAALGPLVRAGGGAVPGMDDGWRCRITRAPGAALFDLAGPGDVVCVLGGVAWSEEGEAGLWPRLERAYLDVSDAMLAKGLDAGSAAPMRPAHLPWCVVVLLPGVALVPPVAVGMLGDLERCLAWAIIGEG
jgi:hypothetical protein